MGVVVCPGCNEANPEHARVCGMCRTPLAQTGDDHDGGRLVTVVTSDLKGSTALGERLDPESLREVLNRYFAVMRVVFESHGGSIEKIIGDAIVAVFGLPFRHDDDAIRAVEAAAESQRALATLNDELEQLWGVRLVNRTGIATGIVHFGRDAEGQHVLIGGTIDESTAMEQNAPALEVLLAASTYAEVADLTEVEDTGVTALKGSDIQIRSHRLISVRSRGTTDDEAAPEPAPGQRVCQVCGEELPERYRYCVNCGATLVTAIARDSRKTVTIVFANPKPHTEHGEPLEPAAFTDVMTRYFEAMKTALERHGGTVEKFIGDAVMAVFGLPVRHEDDALRAVKAAADMQAALPGLNRAFGAEYGVELLNHIGVNTGEVIATGDASTGQRLVTGDAVNTAARLEQAAGAAEIILGELTHRLTRNEIEVDVIPPLLLKGKAEPVTAYRFVAVREPSAAQRGPATPFIGREVEMARLSEALFDAVGHRGARLVTIVGDAGVGKSRLIREFAAGATHEAGLVRGRCLPYGDGITFWPLAEIVRGAAGIASDDHPAEATAKIRGLLAGPAQESDRDEVTDRVAAMLGLSDAEFPVDELTWGMRRLLEALAEAQPLVAIIDDIHSAAPTLLEFFDQLVEAVDGSAILLVCSARHELFERHAEWAAAHADGTVTLVPLSEGELGTLVGELLGDLEPGIRARIAAAAEGNPLYAEQIVSMLQETGAIRREGERWVSTQASGELAIPPTVQALVAARLDALAPDERAVVDPASVIGLSFAEEAITELVDDEARQRLEPSLGSLSAKQLVRRASGDEVLYRFGHLVIRDTAYGSLLKRVRGALHERFVGWAERVNRERGRETEFEEILGYHLEQAYRYRTELGVIDDEARTLGARAAEKLSNAGRRALARGDLPAAANLLFRATELLPRESPVRQELLVDVGETFMQQARFNDAAEVLDGAIELARETGEDRFAVRAGLIRASVDQFRGSEGAGARALQAAREAIRVLEPLDDHAGLARAWRVIAMSEILQGHLAQASGATEHVVEHASAASDTRLVSRTATPIAYALLHGPTPVSSAIAQCDELLANIKGDRKVEAVIFSTQAVLKAMDGDFDTARDLYRRGLEMLGELGAGTDAASTSIDSHRVELLAGDLEGAERELRRDYDVLTELDESYFRSTVAASLANVRWLQGDPDEALSFSEVAEQIADEDDVLTQVPWRIARAAVLASRGEADAARALADAAVELGRATEMPLLQADALVGQARVLAALGAGESSEPPLREALELYEQKGDRISAAGVRRLLGDALEVA